MVVPSSEGAENVRGRRGEAWRKGWERRRGWERISGLWMVDSFLGKMTKQNLVVFSGRSTLFYHRLFLVRIPIFLTISVPVDPAASPVRFPANVAEPKNLLLSPEVQNVYGYFVIRKVLMICVGLEDGREE